MVDVCDMVLCIVIFFFLDKIFEKLIYFIFYLFVDWWREASRGVIFGDNVLNYIYLSLLFFFLLFSLTSSHLNINFKVPNGRSRDKWVLFLSCIIICIGTCLVYMVKVESPRGREFPSLITRLLSADYTREEGKLTIELFMDKSRPYQYTVSELGVCLVLSWMFEIFFSFRCLLLRQSGIENIMRRKGCGIREFRETRSIFNSRSCESWWKSQATESLSMVVWGRCCSLEVERRQTGVRNIMRRRIREYPHE